MGRPPVKPKKMRDGYYVEVRNKRSDVGVKIWSESVEAMADTIKNYERSKDVIVLGQYKNGVWVELEDAKKKAKAKKNKLAE